MKKNAIFLCFLTLLVLDIPAQNATSIVNHTESLAVSNLMIFQDISGALEIEDISGPTYAVNFVSPTEYNVQVNDSVDVYWIRFEMENLDTSPGRFVLSYPHWSRVTFYTGRDPDNILKKTTGTLLPLRQRDYPVANNCYILLSLDGSESKSCWVRLETNRIGEVLIQDLSFSISPKDYVDGQDNQIKSIIYLFMGVYLAMFLYNLFLYFSTREQTYLYYLGMIIFFMYFPLLNSGYLFSLFAFYEQLPENIWIFDAISTTGVAVLTILFIKGFLSLEETSPRWNRILYFTIVAILIIPVLILIDYGLWLAFWNLTVIVYMVMLLIVIIKSYRDKYPSSGFLLFAFMFSILGILVGLLAAFGVLPRSNFTHIYSVPLGSSLEMVLLSFALGNKINLLRRENERKQAKIIDQLQEKKRIQEEAEHKLEEKVKQRTQELRVVNLDLSKKKEQLEETLKNLKEAEAQLIESEKMSTLGQFAAGIAHEVNNSLNFIASSIDPLRLDLSDIEDFMQKCHTMDPKEFQKSAEEIDLKFLFEEVNGLMAGIEDGAKKTKDIVSSLRIFSRVDEEDFKFIDINQGIESTLTLVKYKLTGKTQVIKDLKHVPLVECIPGKLNQVFMNLIINAVQAVEEEGIITIRTWQEEDNVIVSIKDNGTGIPEEVMPHIFEPFFTTKEVGKGTGLGLSVTYGIIEQHKGTIEVESAPGMGTEFKITLPIKAAINENTDRQE